MTQESRAVRALVLSLVATLAARAGAQPTTRPAATTRAAAFEVHEWVILVSDPFQPQANGVKLLGRTTLPQAVDSRRERAPTTQQADPCPVGVIRVVGAGEGTEKIDMRLGVTGGRVLSHWPKAQARASSVLWQDTGLSREPARLDPLPQENWLATLRGGTSAYLTSEGRSERFLLYDVELNYALPLKLAGGATADAPVQLANAGTVALHDVVLYRRDGAGWRTASLAQLPPGRDPPPDKKSATAPWKVDEVFESAAVSTTSPATSPATAPTTQPTTQPLGVDPSRVREVQLAAVPATSASEVLADWRSRLGGLGLVTDDHAVITKILELQALDPQRLTVIYRLDEAELDRLLPLEVSPTPARTVRVGLVVAKNIDPVMPAEVDRLVTQLGDPDWRARERASQALNALGPAARTQLQAATKHADAEIAIRAERLLASMDK